MDASPYGNSKAAADIQALGPDIERAILQIGVRLETIGYMVFRRIVTLETVDDLIGGVTLVFWSRAKDRGERERNRTSNPKFFEWCEWLVNRINERHAHAGPEPAYKLHEKWRP